MNKFKRIMAPMIIGSLLLSGCGSEAQEVESTVSATAVEVMTMQPETITKELVYAGKVEANQTVSVTSKLSGQVESINFDVGDYVNKGDVLFTLDKSDLQDQMAQLEAQLKVSAAGVNSAVTGLQQATSGGQTQNSRLQLETAVKNAKTALDNAQVAVNNSKITVENTKASLDDVEKKYNDYKKLYDAGVIAKSDFDAIELGYTQAKNGYDQAKLGLTSTEATYSQAQNSYNQAVESLKLYDEKITADSADNAKNSVETAQAGKESVEVQLQILKNNINDTAVKSPISGYISQKNIEATNMVSAATAPFVIVDTSIVTVDVKVSEKIINSLSVGQEVDVDIPTVHDEKLTGTIKTINAVADSTGTYPVSVQVKNTDGLLKVGMFANVHFVEQESKDTMVVPRNTVVENQTEIYVYVVENNVAKKVVVETGIDNGESIELVSGVNAGDAVVVTGQSYLSDGSSVNIVNNGEE